MSKHFIEDSEVTRVPFDGGDWVDVKSEFTQADLDFISQSQFKVGDIDVETKKAEVNFTFGEMAMLERGVVAWSFKDEKGMAVPVTPDNLSRLRNPYRADVLKKLNALNDHKKPILPN